MPSPGARTSGPHRAEGPQSAGADEGRRDTTPPSRPPPRPRRGPGSDGVSRKRRRPVRLPMWRACGPLAGGTPALPGTGRGHSQTLRRREFQALGEEVDGSVSGTCSCTWERCPGSAGLWPAPGRRPARRRQERHARAGHTPARGVALGAMGSPGSAGVPSACPCGGPAARCGRDARAPRDGRAIPRASLADPAPQGHSKLSARRLMGPCREHVRVLGSDALGARASGPHRAEGPQGADKNDTPEPATPPPEAWPWERWGLPEAQASRPLAHVAGLRPACGRDARAPRDGTRASLADPAPQGHSKLSARRLMGPCREHVRVLGSDALGARASGPHRAEGPQGADKSDTPEPATPPPEAWPRERCPGSAGLWPASGRRPARRRQEATRPSRPHPRPRRPRERCPGSAGLWPASGRRPARRRQATRPSRPHPRPRRGPGSDGVSRKRRRPVRLPMWRACGPLAGGTPALPGTAPERHSQTLRRRAIPSSRRGGDGSDVPEAQAGLPMWRACGPCGRDLGHSQTLRRRAIPSSRRGG